MAELGSAPNDSIRIAATKITTMSKLATGSLHAIGGCSLTGTDGFRHTIPSHAANRRERLISNDSKFVSRKTFGGNAAGTKADVLTSVRSGRLTTGIVNTAKMF